MVQQTNWVFRRQGFLIIQRMRLSEDGALYLYSEPIAGPQRASIHDEQFPVLQLEVEAEGNTPS